MANLHKRSDSQYWSADFYVEQQDGTFKQVRRSTRIKAHRDNKREALKVANQLEEDYKRGFQANAQGRAISASVMDILRAASAESAKGTLSIDKGKAYLIDIVELATKEHLTVHTLRTWMDDFISIKRDITKLSKASLLKYQQHLDEFICYMEGVHHTKLHGVSSDQIRNYMKYLSSTGLTDSTVNNHFKSIKAYFAGAIRAGHLKESAADLVEKISILDDEESLSHKPFTHDELMALINNAPSDEWRSYIRGAYYTGLRLDDIATLKWGDIDTDKMLIKVKVSKGRRRNQELLIPIHSQDYIDELKELGEGIAGAYVFPNIHNTRGSVISNTFVDIMDKSAVGRGKAIQAKKGSQGDSRGRVRHERSFHSLRSSFVSSLANSGVSKEIRKTLTGHSDDSVHDLYTTIECETLRQDLEKLPSLQRA